MAEQDPNLTSVTPESAAEAPAKPEQTVKVEDIGPARKKLSIELPEARIKEKIESTYSQLRNDAVIPGFRRGRAPRRLIERRFGDSIKDDVKGQLLSEAYTQAVEEQGFDVIGEPDIQGIEDITVPESGPLAFEVEVEVAPEVKLPPFEELSVEKPSAEVTDADVDEEIERLRERFGDFAQVDDATIEADDFVVANVHVYAGENAGDDAEVLAHHHDAHIMVPGESRDFRGHVAGIIVEDLGKRLLGKKPGHVETVSMTGPAGHENEKVRNQPITIKIELGKVERLQPAEVSKLVEQMGVENEQELRDRIRQMLEGRKQQEQQTEAHKQISDQLVDKVELELPEGLTSRQTDRVLRRRRLELLYQGKSAEEVEGQIAEMRSGSEEEARRQLKLFFIIDQAAKDLEIEVGEQELNGTIAMMAMQQGRRPEKMRQEMQQRGELEQLYLQIRERKTLDKIMEKAKVTEAAGDKGGKKKSGGKKKKDEGDETQST